MRFHSFTSAADSSPVASIDMRLSPAYNTRILFRVKHPPYLDAAGSRVSRQSHLSGHRPSSGINSIIIGLATGENEILSYRSYASHYGSSQMLHQLANRAITQAIHTRLPLSGQGNCKVIVRGLINDTCGPPVVLDR